MNNYWQRGFIPTIPKKRNVISHWSCTDSEENFKKNPRPGYTETSITYKYNSHGYRSREFELDSKKPVVLCLGCSFTEGIGVNYEDTWVAHVEKRFPDHLVYNFGISGSSGDAIPRILYNIGGLISPQIVFALWTNIYRYEQYRAMQVVTIHPHMPDGYTPTMLTEENFYNVRQRNHAMTNMLAKIDNFQLIEYNVIDMPACDRGRDEHPGPAWHAEMAKIFLEKYDKSTL